MDPSILSTLMISLDFHEYAKPSKLLTAAEVKVSKDDSVEKTSPPPIPERFESLYKVWLQTSKVYGSGLTDMDTGVLMCLIDEYGSSILQRLPSSSSQTDKWSEDKNIYDTLHFQRGSVDEFIFEGPKLGKIVAVWISLESGQWRVGGLSLTALSYSQPSSAEHNGEKKQQHGLQYNFDVEDVLLGEKSEISVMEFRPCSVSAISEDEAISFSEKPLYESSLVGSFPMSNEESMQEYANLKFSLLFYDAILILAGSSISSLLTGEDIPYAFLTGGMCGFLYLVLLQRSVDGISAPELLPSEKEQNFGQIFGRLKAPITGLVLAFMFAIITVKYASGEDAIKLTAKDLLFGMTGFLLCKVSVLLAAFKPIPLDLRDNKE